MRAVKQARPAALASAMASAAHLSGAIIGGAEMWALSKQLMATKCGGFGSLVMTQHRN